MAKKKITRVSKIEFKGCEARPGPALASFGINMPQFCVKFNEATKDRKGEIVPVVITIYTDKSFDFVLKTTPTAIILKKMAKVEKGASNSQKELIATISLEDAKKIAEYKLPDLNTNSIDSALKIIAGTAKNMGIKIAGLSN